MYGRRTPLVVVEGNMTSVQYRDRILRPIVQPYQQHIGDRFVLQDDNARPHRSHLVNNFLREAQINRMKWPAVSPDMNPIEHAWDQLKQAVRRRRNPPLTLDDLRRATVEEWDRMEQDNLDRLVDSLPRRVRACFNARGAATRY